MNGLMNGMFLINMKNKIELTGVCTYNNHRSKCKKKKTSRKHNKIMLHNVIFFPFVTMHSFSTLI